MTTIKHRSGASWVTLGGVGAAGAAGVGVPAGGLTNTLLVKKSATDYDTEWFNPPHVRVTRVAAGGTLPAAPAFTNVSWDTAGTTYDSTGTMFVPGGTVVGGVPAPCRLWAPRAGNYQVRANVGVTYVAGSRNAMRVLTHTGTVYAEHAEAVGQSTCCASVETTMNIVAGESIYFAVYSNLASSIITAAGYNYAEMRWVAP